MSSQCGTVSPHGTACFGDLSGRAGPTSGLQGRHSYVLFKSRRSLESIWSWPKADKDK